MFCNLSGFQQIKLDIDSLSLKHILRKEWKIPWEVVHVIEECMRLMQGINI